MTKFQPSCPAVAALTWLLDLAAQGAGLKVRGVRGWATAEHISAAVRGWGTPELMRSQWQRGRVLRQDVRAPGDGKPTWVYRISQRGVDLLGTVAGVAPAGIREPRVDPDLETRVYLRDGPAAALDALRLAAAGKAVRPREWVTGESGWRPSWELGILLEQEDVSRRRTPGRTYLSEDMKWLVRLGLAEQEIVEKTHIYRITPIGSAVQRLDWKEPGNA